MPTLTESQTTIIAHAAMKAIREAAGETSLPVWSSETAALKAALTASIAEIRDGSIGRAQDSHEAWRTRQLAAGWGYAGAYSLGLKKDPVLQVWANIGVVEQLKRSMLFALVWSLS